MCVRYSFPVACGSGSVTLQAPTILRYGLEIEHSETNMYRVHVYSSCHTQEWITRTGTLRASAIGCGTLGYRVTYSHLTKFSVCRCIVSRVGKASPGAEPVLLFRLPMAR